MAQSKEEALNQEIAEINAKIEHRLKEYEQLGSVIHGLSRRMEALENAFYENHLQAADFESLEKDFQDFLKLFSPF